MAIETLSTDDKREEASYSYRVRRRRRKRPKAFDELADFQNSEINVIEPQQFDTANTLDRLSSEDELQLSTRSSTVNRTSNVVHDIHTSKRCHAAKTTTTHSSHNSYNTKTKGSISTRMSSLLIITVILLIYAVLLTVSSSDNGPSATGCGPQTVGQRMMSQTTATTTMSNGTRNSIIVSDTSITTKKVFCFYDIQDDFRPQDLNPCLCTHVIYSYVAVRRNLSFIAGKKGDLRSMASLKRKNPKLKLLVSLRPDDYFGFDVPLSSLSPADSMTTGPLSAANTMHTTTINPITTTATTNSNFSDTTMDILHQLPQLDALKTNGNNNNNPAAAGDNYSQQQPVRMNEMHQKFAKRIRDFIVRHSLDGINLDWPYFAQMMPNANLSKEHLTLVLSAINENFQTTLAQSSPSSAYLRTLQSPIVTLTASKDFYSLVDGYDFHQINKLVDYVHLPAFDFDLNVDQYSIGHPARLHGISDVENLDTLVDLLLSSGLPSEQLVAGVPSHGVQITSKPAASLQQSDNRTGPSQQSSLDEQLEAAANISIISHSDVCRVRDFARNNCPPQQQSDDNIKLPQPTCWTMSRSRDLTAPFAYDSEHWIGFDDETSVKLKAKYVLLRRLAGVAMFTVNNDDPSGICGFGPYPLLATVNGVFARAPSPAPTAMTITQSGDINTAASVSNQRTYFTRAPNQVLTATSLISHIFGSKRNQQQQSAANSTSPSPFMATTSSNGDLLSSASDESAVANIPANHSPIASPSPGDSSPSISETQSSQSLMSFVDIIEKYGAVHRLDADGSKSQAGASSNDNGDKGDSELPCNKIGYQRYPRDCSRFYRCVQTPPSTTIAPIVPASVHLDMSQQSPDDNQTPPAMTTTISPSLILATSSITRLQYECPSGLVFDEQYQICNWPSWSAQCTGSGEVNSITNSRFVCPNYGYFQNQENCEYFYYCSDYDNNGHSQAYQFRCPFELGFDEERLQCNWKWLVKGCNVSQDGSKRQMTAASISTSKSGEQPTGDSTVSSSSSMELAHKYLQSLAAASKDQDDTSPTTSTTQTPRTTTTAQIATDSTTSTPETGNSSAAISRRSMMDSGEQQPSRRMGLGFTPAIGSHFTSLMASWDAIREHRMKKSGQLGGPGQSSDSMLGVPSTALGTGSSSQQQQSDRPSSPWRVRRPAGTISSASSAADDQFATGTGGISQPYRRRPAPNSYFPFLPTNAFYMLFDSLRSYGEAFSDEVNRYMRLAGDRMRDLLGHRAPGHGKSSASLLGGDNKKHKNQRRSDSDESYLMPSDRYNQQQRLASLAARLGGPGVVWRLQPALDAMDTRRKRYKRDTMATMDGDLDALESGPQPSMIKFRPHATYAANRPTQVSPVNDYRDPLNRPPGYPLNALDDTAAKAVIGPEPKMFHHPSALISPQVSAITQQEYLKLMNMNGHQYKQQQHIVGNLRPTAASMDPLLASGSSLHVEKVPALANHHQQVDHNKLVEKIMEQARFAFSVPASSNIPQQLMQQQQQLHQQQQLVEVPFGMPALTMGQLRQQAMTGIKQQSSQQEMASQQDAPSKKRRSTVAMKLATLAMPKFITTMKPMSSSSTMSQSASQVRPQVVVAPKPHGDKGSYMSNLLPSLSTSLVAPARNIMTKVQDFISTLSPGTKNEQPLSNNNNNQQQQMSGHQPLHASTSPIPIPLRNYQPPQQQVAGPHHQVHGSHQQQQQPRHLSQLPHFNQQEVRQEAANNGVVQNIKAALIASNNKSQPLLLTEDEAKALSAQLDQLSREQLEALSNEMSKYKIDSPAPPKMIQEEQQQVAQQQQQTTTESPDYVVRLLKMLSKTSHNPEDVKLLDQLANQLNNGAQQKATLSAQDQSLIEIGQPDDLALLEALGLLPPGHQAVAPAAGTQHQPADRDKYIVENQEQQTNVQIAAEQQHHHQQQTTTMAPQQSAKLQAEDQGYRNRPSDDTVDNVQEASQSYYQQNPKSGHPYMRAGGMKPLMHHHQHHHQQQQPPRVKFVQADQEPSIELGPEVGYAKLVPVTVEYLSATTDPTTTPSVEDANIAYSNNNNNYNKQPYSSPQPSYQPPQQPNHPPQPNYQPPPPPPPDYPPPPPPQYHYIQPQYNNYYYPTTTTTTTTTTTSTTTTTTPRPTQVITQVIEEQFFEKPAPPVEQTFTEFIESNVTTPDGIETSLEQRTKTAVSGGASFNIGTQVGLGMVPAPFGGSIPPAQSMTGHVDSSMAYNYETRPRSPTTADANVFGATKGGPSPTSAGAINSTSSGRFSPANAMIRFDSATDSGSDSDSLRLQRQQQQFGLTGGSNSAISSSFSGTIQGAGNTGTSLSDYNFASQPVSQSEEVVIKKKFKPFPKTVVVPQMTEYSIEETRSEVTPAPQVTIVQSSSAFEDSQSATGSGGRSGFVEGQRLSQVDSSSFNERPIEQHSISGDSSSSVSSQSTSQVYSSTEEAIERQKQVEQQQQMGQIKEEEFSTVASTFGEAPSGGSTSTETSLSSSSSTAGGDSQTGSNQQSSLTKQEIEVGQQFEQQLAQMRTAQDLQKIEQLLAQQEQDQQRQTTSSSRSTTTSSDIGAVGTRLSSTRGGKKSSTSRMSRKKSQRIVNENKQQRENRDALLDEQVTTTTTTTRKPTGPTNRVEAAFNNFMVELKRSRKPEQGNSTATGVSQGTRSGSNSTTASSIVNSNSTTEASSQDERKQQRQRKRKSRNNKKVPTPSNRLQVDSSELKTDSSDNVLASSSSRRRDSKNEGKKIRKQTKHSKRPKPRAREAMMTDASNLHNTGAIKFQSTSHQALNRPMNNRLIIGSSQPTYAYETVAAAGANHPREQVAIYGTKSGFMPILKPDEQTYAFSSSPTPSRFESMDQQPPQTLSSDPMSFGASFTSTKHTTPNDMNVAPALQAAPASIGPKSIDMSTVRSSRKDAISWRNFARQLRDQISVVQLGNLTGVAQGKDKSNGKAPHTTQVKLVILPATPNNELLQPSNWRHLAANYPQLFPENLQTLKIGPIELGSTSITSATGRIDEHLEEMRYRDFIRQYGPVSRLIEERTFKALDEIVQRSTGQMFMMERKQRANSKGADVQTMIAVIPDRPLIKPAGISKGAHYQRLIELKRQAIPPEGRGERASPAVSSTVRQATDKDQTRKAATFSRAIQESIQDAIRAHYDSMKSELRKSLESAANDRSNGNYNNNDAYRQQWSTPPAETLASMELAASPSTDTPVTVIPRTTPGATENNITTTTTSRQESPSSSPEPNFPRYQATSQSTTLPSVDPMDAASSSTEYSIVRLDLSSTSSGPPDQIRSQQYNKTTANTKGSQFTSQHLYDVDGGEPKALYGLELDSHRDEYLRQPDGAGQAPAPTRAININQQAQQVMPQKNPTRFISIGSHLIASPQNLPKIVDQAYVNHFYEHISEQQHQTIMSNSTALRSNDEKSSSSSDATSVNNDPSKITSTTPESDSQSTGQDSDAGSSNQQIIPPVSGEESLVPESACTRAGLFQHPFACNKFYECFWDKQLNKYTLHMFECPIKLAFDDRIVGCGLPIDSMLCVNY